MGKAGPEVASHGVDNWKELTPVHSTLLVCCYYYWHINSFTHSVFWAGLVWNYERPASAHHHGTYEMQGLAHTRELSLNEGDPEKWAVQWYGLPSIPKQS